MCPSMIAAHESLPIKRPMFSSDQPVKSWPNWFVSSNTPRQFEACNLGNMSSLVAGQAKVWARIPWLQKTLRTSRGRV